MFAIEGPTVSIWAPSGTFCEIHLPASRPPGTPPEPARNVASPALSIRDQLDANSESEITTTAATATRRSVRNVRAPFGDFVSSPQRAIVRAASSATAGATGRRY